MSDFRFAEPQWIHLIWLVLAYVTIYIWFDLRGSSSLDRFLSPLMQQRLVIRPSRSQRLLTACFLGLSALFLVLALMRPQWGFRYERTARIGAQLMIAMDVSKSMLAEDVTPNRLERAKAEVRDLLAYLDKDYVGLIAFAGRATVVCPLTPDFGFFRLVLESVGPNSVTRGGTNLEAPIRKALAGFRGQSDLSRAIILITDGEDHDSFALEAAKAAAERGIRVIAIGFGDEAGSKVFVTDPQTGARSPLLDADGKTVITRLDGELLRKIALETGGVYIPAGTGALDLKSIYNSHIAPMTRGQLGNRNRLVKQEGFQWAVLLAVLSLVAAVAASAKTPARFGSGRTTVASAMILVTALVLSSAHAQESKGQSPSEEASETSRIKDRASKKTPRELYNQAVALLGGGKLDDAENRFSLARRRAGSDGLTRYRATYNLGWVEVKRAEPQIKDQPEQALRHLRSAAGWFRKAVRLQPGDKAPRENLDIILRRILALSDTLDRHNDSDIESRLDELIQQQRRTTRLLQGTVERVARLEQPTIPEYLRSEFRSLEIGQRKTLAGVDELVQKIREKVDLGEAKKKKDRSAEESLRLVQLRTVLVHLHRADQRLGQTRRQLRQRQAERAYRRASIGLDELKRARDQLHGLVEVLGAVITDAMLLTQQTADFAAAMDRNPGAVHAGQSKPGWLTADYLSDFLTTVRDRTGELADRVDSGIAAGKGPPASSGEKRRSSQRRVQSDQGHFLTALREASPMVHEARGAFSDAMEALASKRNVEAYQGEARATTLLVKARELFLDIRGLIEVIYADEKRIKTTLGQHDDNTTPTTREYLPLLGQLQSANIKRGERLQGLLDRQLERLKSSRMPAGKPSSPTQNGTSSGAVRRRQIDLASQILRQAMSSFRAADKNIKKLTRSKTSDFNPDRLRGSVDQGVKLVEALRRLFFSIIEHLRETARRQVEIADKTRDVATLSKKSDRRKALGPLSLRQKELSRASQQSAKFLEEQSKRNPLAIAGQQKHKGAARAGKDAARRMAQASEHVTEARKNMDQAVDQMDGEAPDLKVAQERQATSLKELLEAIQILSPPPQKKKKQQQRGREQKNHQQNQDRKGAKKQSKRIERADLRHLLQAVRDREAQRQEARGRRRPSGYAPVEKDW